MHRNPKSDFSTTCGIRRRQQEGSKKAARSANSLSHLHCKPASSAPEVISGQLTKSINKNSVSCKKVQRVFPILELYVAQLQFET